MNKNKGFTLVELLIVIAMIGILALICGGAVLFLNMGDDYYHEQKECAEECSPMRSNYENEQCYCETEDGWRAR